MINPIAFQIGPFAIRWYAICILSGLILAVYLARKEAPRKKIKPDDIIDFILIAFPLAIVGARLYYVAFEWSYYSKQPFIEIFITWHGGLAIYGGLITGALVLYFFTRRKFINTLDFLDMVELGEFGLDDFIDCYDSFYYSAHTHAHYFDDPEPRPNPYKDPEFDEEFWEAVDNRMEK